MNSELWTLNSELCEHFISLNHVQCSGSPHIPDNILSYRTDADVRGMPDKAGSFYVYPCGSKHM